MDINVKNCPICCRLFSTKNAIFFWPCCGINVCMDCVLKENYTKIAFLNSHKVAFKSAVACSHCKTRMNELFINKDLLALAKTFTEAVLFDCASSLVDPNLFMLRQDSYFSDMMSTIVKKSAKLRAKEDADFSLEHYVSLVLDRATQIILNIRHLQKMYVHENVAATLMVFNELTCSARYSSYFCALLNELTQLWAKPTTIIKPTSRATINWNFVTFAFNGQFEPLSPVQLSFMFGPYDNIVGRIQIHESGLALFYIDEKHNALFPLYALKYDEQATPLDCSQCQSFLDCHTNPLRPATFSTSPNKSDLNSLTTSSSRVLSNRESHFESSNNTSSDYFPEFGTIKNEQWTKITDPAYKYAYLKEINENVFVLADSIFLYWFGEQIVFTIYFDKEIKSTCYVDDTDHELIAKQLDDISKNMNKIKNNEQNNEK